MILSTLIAASVATQPAPAPDAKSAPSPAAEKKMACCEKMAKGESCCCCKDMAVAVDGAAKDADSTGHAH